MRRRRPAREIDCRIPLEPVRWLAQHRHTASRC